MSSDQSSARRQGFHFVKMTSDEHGNAVTVTELADGETLTTITPKCGTRLRFDITKDPRFLGDPPEWRDGKCTYCGEIVHRLDGVKVTARAAHRFDRVPSGGYYADEYAERGR